MPYSFDSGCNSCLYWHKFTQKSLSNLRAATAEWTLQKVGDMQESNVLDETFNVIKFVVDDDISIQLLIEEDATS